MIREKRRQKMYHGESVYLNSWFVIAAYTIDMCFMAFERIQPWTTNSITYVLHNQVYLIVDEAAKSSSLVLHICNHKPKSRHPSEKHGTKGSVGVYKHLTMVKHLSKVLYLIMIRNYSAQFFFKELNSSNITKQQAFSDM